ncbi:TolC family protein [Thioalkalivibrio sulfidiphilus]|uniref:TolC family protein n=1 Tax=Thioalkalivibrio sulfidiphilus TaxID=1033854 RepID=UPI003B37EA10
MYLCLARTLSAVFGLVLLSLTPLANAQWTLERSIEQALSVAPELDAADARIEATRAAARQAGTWPNPTLELKADNAMARDRGGDSHEFSELAITQPLPLGLSSARRAAGDARVLVATEARRAERLNLEYRVATAYHRLQLAQALLAQSRQAAREAEGFADIAERRAAQGDISRRETLRLQLLSSEAKQLIESAEGEWQEARSAFASLLNLAPEQLGELPPLEDVPEPQGLTHWTDSLDSHPNLQTQREHLTAVLADKRIARAERLPQLGVRVFAERDRVDGRRETVTGVGLALEVPLWDRRQGRLGELAASSVETQARLSGEHRQLLSRVQVQHQHLTHLVVQARQQRSAVLEPAREILGLSSKGYLSGELDLLALVEALHTVRQAENRQLQLLADAWQELAALRASAGIFLAPTDSE